MGCVFWIFENSNFFVTVFNGLFLLSIWRFFLLHDFGGTSRQKSTNSRHLWILSTHLGRANHSFQMDVLNGGWSEGQLAHLMRTPLIVVANGGRMRARARSARARKRLRVAEAGIKGCWGWSGRRGLACSSSSSRWALISGSPRCCCEAVEVAVWAMPRRTHGCWCRQFRHPRLRRFRKSLSFYTESLDMQESGWLCG